MPSPPSGGDSTTTGLRDSLAAAFAQALAQELGTVTEILDHQLASTDAREKWKALRLARDAVRDCGPVLAERLAAQVRGRFDAKLAPGDDALSQTSRFSLDSLSLVSEEEVQEEIAVGNAARRLREATGDDFFALNTRLAAAMGRERLAEEHSPVHPRVFARALLDVLADATAEPPARLAALAAFDPAMLHALPKAYRAGNALLVSQGILPHLRVSYGAPRQVAGARAATHGMTPPASPAPAQAPPGAAAGAAPGLFDRLLAGAAAAAQPSQPLVTLQVRPELVAALRSLEARLPAAAPASAIASDASGPAPSPTADLIRRAREEMAGALTPADELVADLVAATFARLFEDPDLAEAAKVQLGRLQLPVFKAVMADRRFFVDPAHPIRGLIDAIAELGATGGAHAVEGRRPEEWIATEVQALLGEEPPDAKAFSRARDRLAQVAERCHEALADHDDVVRSVKEEDAERSAVQESALEVAHRIAAAECTPAAAAFAYRAWRPVLAGDHRRFGPDSPQWREDVATLDDLLWTLAPRATTVERERLAELMPSVRFRLWQGLIRTRLASAQIEAVLDQLDRLHQSLQSAPLAAAQADATTTVAALAPVAGDDFTATLHVGGGPGDDGLARGAWFEFVEADGTRTRARVAWVSPVQGACVFKDLARNRSFAVSLDDLRERRATGRALAVDGPGVASSSIEAALEAVARSRGAEPGT